MTSFLFYLTIVLFIIVCLFMILLILIQKGRGGGLASAFGGAGGNTAFGSKTGDVLTWATSIVFGVFLVLAVALNLFANARHNAANVAATNTTRTPVPSPSTPGAGPLSLPTSPVGGPLNIPASSDLDLLPETNPATPPVDNPSTRPQ